MTVHEIIANFFFVPFLLVTIFLSFIGVVSMIFFHIAEAIEKYTFNRSS